MFDTDQDVQPLDETHAADIDAWQQWNSFAIYAGRVL